MKLLVLVFLFALVSLADSDSTFHITAAANAYESGKEALQEKQTEKAVTLFRQAIDIEPTFMEAFQSLAGVYLDSGRPLEAAAVLTQLLEFEPDAVKSRLILAEVLSKERQPRRALAQFSLVLQHDPFNPEALLGLASAAQQIGLADRASEVLERGRKRYPSDARFRLPPATPLPP
jgi:tetratricopeptide (TPR) repeat protein